MNKKGQLELGTIVVLAVTLILGAVFMTSIVNEQVVLTNTQSVTNDTVTFPNNGSTLTLRGQSLVGSITAVNATNSSSSVPATNFTTNDLVQTGGEYRLVLTNNDADWNGESVNLTYTYEPVGYNRDGGSRGIAPLPSLFFAIALLLTAVMGVRNWLNK